MAVVLKVASKTNPNALAGAIAGEMKNTSILELHAIGAGPVNQAVKAIAIARGIMAPNGYNLVCIPSFSDATLEDKTQRTIIKFILKNQ